MGAHFFPAGRGIGHQIMCEEGFAWPGTMAVASDSHSNMYGAMACLGTPVVRTDAAAIWATGRTWWQVPPVVKIIFEGRLREEVCGKDIIIALCSYFSHDEVLNCALEFTGNAIKCLSVEDRLTIANMTTEWGALAAVFPFDNILLNWIRANIARYEVSNNSHHPRLNYPHLEETVSENITADNGAHYEKEIRVNLSTILPCVAGPDTVKKAEPVSRLRHKNIKINKAYLLSCYATGPETTMLRFLKDMIVL